METVIIGAVWGVMLVTAWGAIVGIKRLFSSQSEGAKRIKIVLGALVALAVIGFILHDFGFTGLIFTAVLVVIVTWVARGFRK